MASSWLPWPLGDTVPSLPDLPSLPIPPFGEPLPNEPGQPLPQEPGRPLPHDWLAGKGLEYLQTLIDKIKSGLTSLTENLEKLAKLVIQVASDTAADIVNWVQDGLQKYGQLLGWLRDAVSRYPLYRRLVEASEGWLAVQRYASGASSMLTPLQLGVNLKRSAAREPYLWTITAQSDAAKRVGASAGITADRVDRVSGYMINYYANIGSMVAKLVNTATAALLKAGGLNAQAVIDIFKDVINTLVDQGVNYTTLYSSLRIWCAPALKNELNDQTPMPGGQWPKPFTKFGGATAR
jgi:hypothetical protein